MNRLYRILLVVSVILASVIVLHSGKTDGKGGHRDNSTGEYHYHHGYPAHDHYDMDGDGKKDCPYDFKDKTDHSSNSSSNNSDTTNTEAIKITDEHNSFWKAAVILLLCVTLVLLLISFVKILTRCSIKLRSTMLITAIIGFISTMIFVIFFDIEDYEIILLPVLFYVLEYFIIGYGFRWKFNKETYWVATLCFLPFIFEIFVSLIIGYLFSTESFIVFIEWSSMICVTVSVLIFEYKFATHDKK